MIKVYAKRGEQIYLGREGTYGVRQVIFDFTMWVDMFGAGNVQLIAKRPDDKAPYLVPLEISGEKAVWTITAPDTAQEGEGKCELQYHVNGNLEKSQIYTTYIEKAMEIPGEAPEDPAKGYYDKVIDAAIRVENAVVKAPIIFADTWWTWDFEKGEYVDTGVIAAGGDGSGSGLVITNTAAVGQTVKITAIDADGKPTEWEAVDFPEGGVQSDWSQNDESQPDFVKNRTHYDYVFEPIEWDGNTEGRDSIDVSALFGYPEGSLLLYKFSDRLLTEAEMLQIELYCDYGGGYAHLGFSQINAVSQNIINVTYSGDIKIDLFFVTGTDNELGVYIPSQGSYSFDFQTLDIINGRDSGLKAIKLGDSAENRATPISSRFLPWVAGKTFAGRYVAFMGADENGGGEDAVVKDDATAAAVNDVENNIAENYGFAQGKNTKALVEASFAGGKNTVANGTAQMVIGENNVVDKRAGGYGEHIFIAGNGRERGAGNKSPSNAHTLDWDGVGWYAGGLKVGGTGQDDAEAKPVLLEGDVYSKAEIDAIMGSYINDIAAIVGGDA